MSTEPKILTGEKLEQIEREFAQPDSFTNPDIGAIVAGLIFNIRHFRKAAEEWAEIVENRPTDPALAEWKRDSEAWHSLNSDKPPMFGFLHSHPKMESECKIDGEHVIVDKIEWEVARRKLSAIESIIDKADAIAGGTS